MGILRAQTRRMGTDLVGLRPGAGVFFTHFDPNLFVLNLESTTKDEALRELTDRLAQGAGVRTLSCFSTCRRRESLGSTGIGKGAAIP
ncbi:MAG: PTS sugar transporter subunit IIA [Candidatus Eisenbacteria bacterium]